MKPIKSLIKTVKYSAFIFQCFVLLFTPFTSSASIVPCHPIPTTGPNGESSIANNCTFNQLLEIPVNIFNFLLSSAAIVLLAVIIWSGIRMLLFYASDSPEAELENAKLTLRRGIFGFFIIACSYLIVNILAVTILGLNPASAVGKLLQQFGLI